MSQPTHDEQGDDRREPPANQAWIEMEDIRGGLTVPAHDDATRPDE
ncbi:hypothetical protein ACFVYA_44390 [Amycolatopsis sp. NPDC058278]